MATIRDVAQLAGVSTSTVSIVLNRKNLERKIPNETCHRVWEAARKLDYRPSVSARKLRVSGEQNELVIVIYWANDFRASMMVRFLKGLEQAIAELPEKPELLIRPYQNGKLCEDTALLTGHRFHAAIIANASKADLEFLETARLAVPVVLYNRRSEHFSHVTVDDEKMGQTAGQLFKSTGQKSVGIFTSEQGFPGMGIRERALIRFCQQSGIEIWPENIITTEHSIAGGADAAGLLLKAVHRPSAIFCASDLLALGALNTFARAGIRVPADLSVLAIGNGESEYSEFSIPPLTVVHLPMEEMARRCLKILLDILSMRQPYQAAMVEAPLIRRQSVGIPEH